MKPKIVLTRQLPDSIETRMRELFDATLNDTDEALSREELIEIVKTADVIVPTVTDIIDGRLSPPQGQN